MRALATATGALALMLLASAPAASQAMRLDGWWVVLGSVKDDGTQAPHRQIEAIRARMRGCGIDMFSDQSSKFVGFAPGLLVAAVGAYRSEKEALAQMPKLRSCAPDAYVKKARHTGE